MNNALTMLDDDRIYGSSAPDWVCNVAQSLGRETGQYNAAMTIGNNLPKSDPENNTFVSVNAATSFDKYTGWIITGHSLGGGLASAAAGVCGNIGTGQVDTFNAAGLFIDTVDILGNPRLGTVNTFLDRTGHPPIQPREIMAYRTESCELTELQEETPGVNVPRAVGTEYWLEDDVLDQRTNGRSEQWTGHTMHQVIQGLCVDAIGQQLNDRLYIIDKDGGWLDNGRICYRGDRNQPAAGTIDIRTLYNER